MNTCRNLFCSLSQKRLIWDAILFIFVILWLYPQMTHGIFISDTAYHLYEADQAFNLYGRPFNMFWLTSYVGGFWMSLNPTEMVCWWAALGGCLTCALTYIMAAHIIPLVLPCKRITLYICLFVTVIFQMHFIYNFAIHYYTLPFLWAEIAVYLYLKSLSKEKHKLSLIYLILSALTASLLPSLRLPLILLVFFPVGFEIAQYTQSKRISWRRIAFYSCTALLGLIASYLFFLLWKSYFPELNQCAAPINKHMQLLDLVELYIYYYDHAILRASMWLGGVFLLYRLSVRIQTATEIILVSLLLFCSIGLGIYTYSGAIPYCNFPFYYLIRSQEKIVIFLMMLSLLWYFREKKKSADPRIKEHWNTVIRLLFISLFVIIYPVGTDNTARILHGFPLTAPLCMLLLKQYAGWDRKRFAMCIFSLVPLSLAIQPLNVGHHTTPHNRVTCNYPYTLLSLKGMYETEERVKNHELLIKTIQQYSKPKEEILFLSNIYELLYFSGRRNWMQPFHRVPEFNQSSYSDYIKMKPLPEIAVMDYSEDENVRDSWEQNVLLPYYEKIYSTDCSPSICHGKEKDKAEFSVWRLKKDTEKTPHPLPPDQHQTCNFNL